MSLQNKQTNTVTCEVQPFIITKPMYAVIFTNICLIMYMGHTCVNSFGHALHNKDRRWNTLFIVTLGHD